MNNYSLKIYNALIQVSLLNIAIIFIRDNNESYKFIIITLFFLAIIIKDIILKGMNYDFAKFGFKGTLLLNIALYIMLIIFLVFM